MKKNIRKLSEITATSGLSLFLVVGFSGCLDQNNCRNSKNLMSQKEMDECRNQTNFIGNGSGAGSSSSTFVSGGHSNSSTVSSTATETTTAKSSGFFGSGIHGKGGDSAGG